MKAAAVLFGCALLTGGVSCSAAPPPTSAPTSASAPTSTATTVPTTSPPDTEAEKAMLVTDISVHPSAEALDGFVIYATMHNTTAKPITAIAGIWHVMVEDLRPPIETGGAGGIYFTSVWASAKLTIGPGESFVAASDQLPSEIEDAFVFSSDELEDDEELSRGVAFFSNYLKGRDDHLRVTISWIPASIQFVDGTTL